MDMSVGLLGLSPERGLTDFERGVYVVGSVIEGEASRTVARHPIKGILRGRRFYQLIWKNMEGGRGR